MEITQITDDRSPLIIYFIVFEMLATFNVTYMCFFQRVIDEFWNRNLKPNELCVVCCCCTKTRKIGSRRKKEVVIWFESSSIISYRKYAGRSVILQADHATETWIVSVMSCIGKLTTKKKMISRPWMRVV